MKIKEHLPLILYCMVKSIAAFWFLTQFVTWGLLSYTSYNLLPNMMTDFLEVWKISAAFAMQILYSLVFGYMLFGIRREHFIKKKQRGRNGR